MAFPCFCTMRCSNTTRFSVPPVAIKLTGALLACVYFEPTVPGGGSRGDGERPCAIQLIVARRWNGSTRRTRASPFFGASCSSDATVSERDACSAAPTAAYCWRNSSWAFADQGINSASRQIQSFWNCSHSPAASQAVRTCWRKSFSIFASSKNRLPVRVQQMPIPSPMTPKPRRAAS